MRGLCAIRCAFAAVARLPAPGFRVPRRAKATGRQAQKLGLNRGADSGPGEWGSKPHLPAGAIDDILSEY